MPRPKRDGLPAGIRKRKTATPPFFLYEISFLTPNHGRRYECVGTDLREAKRRLAEREREVGEGAYEPGVRSKHKMTVTEFSEKWLDEREGEVLTIDDDRTRFALHILPVLGHMRLEDVQPYHLVDFLGVLRRKVGPHERPLSKNTIRNVWANVVTFFADAEQRGLILRTPCAGVRKAQRPKKASRAETQGIAFTSEQVSSLISDQRIPEDRRVLYAMVFLMGERFGEAAGHRWKDNDPVRKPLGHMRLERQYEDRPLKGKRGEGGPPRDIPVHPTLAAMLAEWRASGFPKMFGRHPEPEDFIVPSRLGRCRTLKHGARRLNEDCARVGIAWKDATHVARRTFITLAMAGGAGEAWVKRITHNANGDVLTGYQVDHWGAMCAAVLCVKVERLAMAEVIDLQTLRAKTRQTS